MNAKFRSPVIQEFCALFIVFLTTIGVALAESPTNGTSARIDWELVDPYPTSAYLVSVASGPSGYVAVAVGGEILFSSDGLQWEKTEPASQEPGMISLDWVVYANDRFLVTGHRSDFSGFPGSDNPTPLVLWSTNGLNWVDCSASIPMGVPMFGNRCAGENGLYFLAPQNTSVLVSTNCADWEETSSPPSLLQIARGETNWVAVSPFSVFTSPNLENWTEVYGLFSPEMRSFASVAYGNGRFVATGGLDATSPVPPALLYWSADGIQWHNASAESLDAWGMIRTVTFANGRFVAFGRRAIYTSTDGVSWQTISNVPNVDKIRCVTGRDGHPFVAVGDRGEILVSNDGQTWKEVTTNPRFQIRALTFADGRFVAVGGDPDYIGAPGSGAVLTSKTGDRWQCSLTNLTVPLNAVAFGNRTWVVVGDDGHIFTSRDAVHWADRSLATHPDFLGLLFSGGAFKTFTFSTPEYRSVFGLNWRKVAPPLYVEMERVWSARQIKRTLFAVGSEWTLPLGNVVYRVYSSADGLRWKPRSLPVSEELLSVAYGNGRYVAGGDSFVLWSRNGSRWNKVNIPLRAQHLAFCRGWFIAMDWEGNALVSQDAMTWHGVQQMGGMWVSALVSGNEFLIKIAGQDLYRGVLRPPER